MHAGMHAAVDAHIRYPLWYDMRTHPISTLITICAHIRYHNSSGRVPTVVCAYRTNTGAGYAGTVEGVLFWDWGMFLWNLAVSPSISKHVGLNWLFGAIFLVSWRPWKTFSSSVLVVNHGPCQGQNRWCYFTISHTNKNVSPNSLSTLNISQHTATIMFYLAKEDYLANRIVKQGGFFWKSFSNCYFSLLHKEDESLKQNKKLSFCEACFLFTRV